MKIFKDNDAVIVNRGSLIQFGKVCRHKDDDKWITVHVVNGKQGEYVKPENLRLAHKDDYRRALT